MIGHRLIPIICCLLVIISYSVVLINDNIEAQVGQNTLKSIINQTAPTKAQISVGKYPSFSGLSIIGNYLYVANSGSDTVSVIAMRNNTVVKDIPVGMNPTFIQTIQTNYGVTLLRRIMSPSDFGNYLDTIGNYLYVANSGSDTVSVIDMRNNTVVKDIPVGMNPSAFGTEIIGNYLYVANSGSDTVSVIDMRNNTVVKDIPVGMNPSAFGTEIIGNLYVANSGYNTVSVIDQTNDTLIKNITVGMNPTFIDISRDSYTYVANTGSNTISVINTTENNNTVMKDIPVGEAPTFIDAPSRFETFADNYTYVANTGSNTISVINTTENNNTVMKDIPVGPNPTFIQRYGVALYVANSGSNTTSVIDTRDYTVVYNITVGMNPTFIQRYGDALYIGNSGSNSVSLVDPLTNEEVAGMKFDIKPFGAGQIICNGLDAPLNRFLFVTSGAKCTAKSKTGFEFSSWSQNLPRNTNVTINASTPSDWLGYPLTSLREAFTDDPAATFTVNRFGNFTAYFKALPPPVSTEFTASLITVIVAAFVGSLLIPALLSWFKSKKQTSRLNSFHQKMISINKDGLDETDFKNLNELNQHISNSYAAGKITNEQYTNLKNEVSIAFQEIFKKRIELLTEQDLEAINKTRNDIMDAYNNGKLSNEHYTNLKNEVSNTYQKIFKNGIESLTDPDTEAISMIKNNIRDAYADGKITETHYKLLNEKISDMLDKK